MGIVPISLLFFIKLHFRKFRKLFINLCLWKEGLSESMNAKLTKKLVPFLVPNVNVRILSFQKKWQFSSWRSSGRRREDADGALDVHKRAELGWRSHQWKHDHGKVSRRIRILLFYCSVDSLYLRWVGQTHLLWKLLYTEEVENIFYNLLSYTLLLKRFRTLFDFRLNKLEFEI